MLDLDKDWSKESVNANSRLYNDLVAWSKLVCWIIGTLIYSGILAYIGFFNLPAVVLGSAALFLAAGAHKVFWYFSQKFYDARKDLLGIILVAACLLWLCFLLLYAPFPAFSGRDEGSYANAAVYLAKFGSVNFQLPLLSYLKGEGLAHQSLNFPGFVIRGESLSSQFSPAYYIFLGIVYLVTETTVAFPLANGLLILGGVMAFYTLLRLFFFRWISFAGMLLVMFHFLFLWFPRFTLSENLAFFLFSNLVLFLITYRFFGDRIYLMPVILCSVTFPLTRPEGWWLLLVVIFLLIYWHYKKIVILSFAKLKKELLILTGVLAFNIYVAVDQLPIYKRLVRDWLKWSNTADSYQQLGRGSLNFGEAENILSALFPSWQRLWYFVKVEWIYGILIFGVFALATMVVYLWTRKTEFFARSERFLIGLTALLSLPFFAAFVSPQISPDHPWMLRRFLFVLLPLGVLAALVLGLNIIKKLPKNWSFAPAAILMAALLIPSIPATGYFLTAQIDGGREEVLERLGSYFKEDDFVFLERESSGDGWHMWAEPLSSIYGINAAYVYSPQNVIEMKEALRDRFLRGQRSYIVLSDQSYHFEHEIAKNFNMTLDKEYRFQNISLNLKQESEGVGFPLLEKREYIVKIYLLSPR